MIKTVRIQINFDLSENELEFYVKKAVMVGFKRVEPGKGWTIAERKEAVRFAITHVIYDEARALKMYIVMKNAQDCELDRKQVFHNQTLKQALLSFISDHEAEPGDKYEIVESDD